MTTTTNVTLPANGTWTQVSTGSPSVTVQLQSRGPVRVKVQASAPAGGDETGLLLDADIESVFAANALAGTDNTYLRSISGKDEYVVVLAT